VGDVQPLLARAGGVDAKPVHIEDGAVEEVRGLLGPDAEAHRVDGVLELANGFLREATAEVARRGGIGDPTGSQGVEKDLVLAA
jgi:hypothetical protein